MKTFILEEKNREAVSNYLLSIKWDGWYMLEVKKVKERRRLAQNRLAFLWYKTRSSVTGLTPEEEHSYCKLSYGVPIMSTYDEDFAELYMMYLNNRPYEEQMKLVKFIPVTRLMNVTQFAEYLTDIESASITDGIALERPDDLYYEAVFGARRPK